MNYDMKKCGERIRQIRKQHGYTQEGLAGELNMDRSVLSRIEVGKYACTIDFLAQISVFFDVSLDYLVFGKVLGGDAARLKASVTGLIRHLEQFKGGL